MTEKTVNVPKISCGHCVMNIKREVSQVPGVKSVEADAATKKVTVQWEAPADWDKIAAALTEAGYPAE